VKWIDKAFLAAVLLLLIGGAAAGQGDAGPEGLDLLDSVEEAVQPQRITGTLALLILLTVLSLAPAILVMTTSFTRIVVVLGFLRQAMATQQSPPAQVIVGLSLFLTFFVMTPTYQRVYSEAYVPYRNGVFDAEDQPLAAARDAALGPIREFMFKQTRPKDLAALLRISGQERPNTPDDVATVTLIPAFVVSELRKAFIIGFLIYIPFLMIDMVVASTLMSMGMMMLPPVFVSLPFKIVMFVLADGWNLLVVSLVESFQ